MGAQAQSTKLCSCMKGRHPNSTTQRRADIRSADDSPIRYLIGKPSFDSRWYSYKEVATFDTFDYEWLVGAMIVELLTLPSLGEAVPIVQSGHWPALLG